VAGSGQGSGGLGAVGPVRRADLTSGGWPSRPKEGGLRVAVGCFPVNCANAAVPAADRLRGAAYQLRVWSKSKAGAGSAAEGSNAGLWSNGASHCGGPRAGETGGGWVGSPRC
jgi:hypothetical protein